MRYIARRLGFYLIAAWAALTLNFVIPRLMPGNPAEAVMAQFHGRISPQAIHALYALFGLGHKSLWSQYVTYWHNLLMGNLGVSFTYFPAPVIRVIENSLPWTVVLVGTATVVSFATGTLIGIWVAWRRGTWWDAIMPASMFFSSIPYFWFGLIVLLILSQRLPLFPPSGAYSGNVTVSLSWGFIGSAVYHWVLPAGTVVIASIGGWVLGMRNMMVTTLAEDFVLLAEGEGLPRRRVMLAYAARNAILPSVANFALSLGFVVSGAILTEIVFSYPGIGYQLFEAVSNEDYPLMQGIFLVITIAVLVANLLADVVYVLLDPRARQDN